MDPARAKEIIQSLADGRDPATGEQFPPNSPYQQADTVRALHVALAALSALSAPPREKTPRRIDPTRPKIGASWSAEEEQQLRDAFAAGVSPAAIANTHGRTPGAITSRLVKLGLIEDNPTNRAGQGNRPGLSASAGPSRRSPDGWRGSAPPAGAKTDAPPTMPADLSQEEKDDLPF